ncbi:hypothetical protein [Chitinimonas sp.]|uniref:hypothetical protein n=1 Tax=Chitinimonas sp. TaxID=1934313 RepID=UPI002F922FA3
MPEHQHNSGTETTTGKVRSALTEMSRQTRTKLSEHSRQAAAYCHAMEDSNYDYVARHPAASLAAVAVAGAAVGYLLGTRSKPR